MKKDEKFKERVERILGEDFRQNQGVILSI